MGMHAFKGVIVGMIGMLVLVSCQKSIELTDSGKSVGLLEKPEEYPQCTLLGDVKSMTLISDKNGYQQSLNNMKNKVAEMKGTHLKVVSSEADELATMIQGVAYRCRLTEEGEIKEVAVERESWMIVE